MRVDDRIRVLAFGSNVNADRLQAYISGSASNARYGTHTGSLDPTPPTQVASDWIRGRLRFGGVSRRWGPHGIAYADLAGPAKRLFVVEYEMSWQQLVDLVAQENGMRSLEIDTLELEQNGLTTVSDRFYNSLVKFDRGADSPAVLLTHLGPTRYKPPAPRYIEVIREGLEDFMSPDEAARYLREAQREPGADATSVG